MTLLAELARADLGSLGERPVSSLLADPAAPLARYRAQAALHPDLAEDALLARARYLEGTEAHAAYAKLSLSQPVTESIARRQKALEGLTAIYGDCIAYGVAEHGRAAAFQIGLALIEFGEALAASERPRDLSGEDLAAYEEVLLEESWTFFDRGEATWSELLRSTREVEEDPGEWIARTRERLWPRLGEKFLFRPEVEHPEVAAAPIPFPAEAEKLAGAPPDTASGALSSLDDTGGDR
jgi:hypothetical protein